MQRKKRELHSDLPARSDPTYMKLYQEKYRQRGLLIRRERIAKKLAENPNYWKEKYDPEKAKEYRAINRKILTEKQWIKRGIVGMSYERFEKELKKQKGKCLICTKQMKTPNVDHDHKTGLYRGLLCIPCNNGLGIYENRKEEFQAYLEKYS